MAFAALDVATRAVRPDGAIIGVLGNPLTVAECPPVLRVFMTEVGVIGMQAKAIEDNMVAMRLAERGREIPLSRLDREEMILEEGMGWAAGCARWETECGGAGSGVCESD